MPQPQAISPVRVYLLIIVVVFTVEFAIMFVLARMPDVKLDDALLSFIDATVLVTAICPALWILVVRPLRTLVNERGALLERTLRIQEQERAKLARDLHDELGQIQTAILLGLRSISNAQSLESSRERADNVHQMAVSAVDSVRRMARGLSPGVLTDFGLGQAVERVCEDVAAASGIEVVRDISLGAIRLDPAVEIAAYRVIQEAITNAAKHSNATTIRVEMSLDDGQLKLSVTDNGKGITAPSDSSGSVYQGLGLAAMRERIVLLSGAFSVSSSKSAGTTLRASLPAHPITT